MGHTPHDALGPTWRPALAWHHRLRWDSECHHGGTGAGSHCGELSAALLHRPSYSGSLLRV